MSLSIIFLTAFGLFLLLSGANYLIKNIVLLAEKINVSHFVIASCTIALGTTIPELATSLKAILSEPSHPGIAVGNLIGSNIANILLIIGLASILYPIKISFNKLIKTEIKISFFIILFPTSIFLLHLSKTLSFYLSIIMIISLIYFLYERIMFEEKILKKNKNIKNSIFFLILMIILSFIAIFIGSYYFINGSVEIAEYFNVSERIIGLSLVAIGTSMPELITVIIASIKKLQGIALGNILGANTYNILGILSIIEVIEPSSILKSINKIDIYFLVFSTVLLSLILLKGRNINRLGGFVFLTIYFFYIYLIYY